MVRTDVTAAYEQEQRQLLLVQDALRQAEHANAAKSDFLARMSHDLRTPLGGVIGLSYLAMGDTLPPADIKRYLAEIHRSGEYLLGIINDILDMSKIENKKLELHPEPVPFSDFSGTLRDVIDVQCGEKHQTFEIAGPAGNAVRCIRVDKTRFIQIFVNLLTNAVKYTPEGGHIRFTVEQLSRTETVVLVRFTVQDDGTGMSPEFLAHAFEPFERERDDGQIGTGLGLAIVRNLVELMGGTIRIDSAPGKGTAAVVELPLEIAPEPKRESPQREWTSLAGRRFLLCEDNDINAEIAAELLKNVSAASDRAADGEIGLERFITSPPGTYDAILMDVRMPRMDGIAAAAAIRGLDRPDARTVPIIALTANAFEEDRERCLSAGMKMRSYFPGRNFAKKASPLEKEDTCAEKPLSPIRPSSLSCSSGLSSQTATRNSSIPQPPFVSNSQCFIIGRNPGQVNLSSTNFSQNLTVPAQNAKKNDFRLYGKTYGRHRKKHALARSERVPALTNRARCGMMHSIKRE